MCRSCREGPESGFRVWSYCLGFRVSGFGCTWTLLERSVHAVGRVGSEATRATPNKVLYIPVPAKSLGSFRHMWQALPHNGPL